MIVIAAGVNDAPEIERTIALFGREPNGALVVVPHPVTLSNRELIIREAARYRLPAVYPFRYFVVDGGLVSYGIDQMDMYRRAAPYIDRIFKGTKPSELPVQASDKFELIINTKTAKALGLTVPPTLLARADEVIE